MLADIVDVSAKRGNISGMAIFIGLIFFGIVQAEDNLHLRTAAPNQTCGPWFFFNHTTSECQCGNSLNGIIKCQDGDCVQENAVIGCYCMTHDEEIGTVAGACFYNCQTQNVKEAVLYRKLPLNLTLLNDVMCGTFKRTGRLCGECKEGYQISAYSYDMKCTRCSISGVRGWIIYFCVAFLPLTAFFILVLLFRISATSPKMAAYVFLAQTVATPANVRIILSTAENYPHYMSSLAQIVLAMYGVWNLDFFRTFMPPICLDINTLQVLALDYVIAVYPLALVVLAYVMIQLHGRGCLLLTILWMPFKKCHTRLQRRMNAKASIIDVFASFLVLSHVKFLSVSFDLLVPTSVRNVTGERLGLYLYYDATFEYFGRKHLPYGILALCVSFFFLILPLLLLLLYPLKIFQRLFGNWQVLRIFIDSFQGIFKDGVVEGKYDYRYFSAAYLIMRIALFLTYAFTLSGHFYSISVILLLISALIMSIVKPYKQKLSAYVTVDIVMMLLLAIWFASTVDTALKVSEAQKSFFSLVVYCLTAILPLFYIPLLLLRMLWLNPTFRKMLNRALFSCRKIIPCSLVVLHDQSLSDSFTHGATDDLDEQQSMLCNDRGNYNSFYQH